MNKFTALVIALLVVFLGIMMMNLVFKLAYVVAVFTPALIIGGIVYAVLRWKYRRTP